MSGRTNPSQHQRFPRVKRRVTCDLLIQGQQFSGLVTDISANGLYVRTRAKVEPGSMARVILHEGQGELELDVQVARGHRMSRHHTTGIPSGLGLQILAAPEEYFQLLAALAG